MPVLSPHSPTYLHIHQAQNPSPTSTPTKSRILARFPHPPSPDNSPKDSHFGFGPYRVAQEGFELVTAHFVAQRTTLMDTSWTSPHSPDQRVFVGAGLAAWPEIPIMPTVCSRRSYRWYNDQKESQAKQKGLCQFLRHTLGRACLYTCSPSIRSLRQTGCEFKAFLGHTVKPFQKAKIWDCKDGSGVKHTLLLL